MTDRNLRFLIVGLGSVGRRHLANLRSLGHQDILAARSRGLPVAELSDDSMFTGLEAALDRQPHVVLVTNPTCLHASTALLAAERGCHVFVEKPLSHTFAGVETLLQAVRDRRLIGMVGYQFRFHPVLRHAKKLVDEGAIGRPLSARIEYGDYLPDWHPWEDYRSGYSAKQELSGGPVLTLSHTLDMAYWLFGQPAQVSCRAARVSDLEIDTDDTAEMVLEYASGPLCTVHVDYVRRPPRRTVEIVGDGGVLSWDDSTNHLAWYSAGDDRWTVYPADPGFTRNQMFLDELSQFVECVRSGGRPSVTLDDGAQVLAIALAASESAASGRPVPLSSFDRLRMSGVGSG